METATIREVQHNLAAYVRRVEHGQEIQIRRRNRIVARLVTATAPPAPGADPQWGAVRERLHRRWGGKPAPGKATSEILYEARGER
jgi:antitoxin (DNA-binding transcriptional repressor) of toxin-antitoxin stability system